MAKSIISTQYRVPVSMWILMRCIAVEVTDGQNIKFDYSNQSI